MKNSKMNRRSFIEKSVVAGAAGMIAPSLYASASANPTPGMIRDNISIAQWALVHEIREGKWKTLDFPRIAREDFGIEGIEFVNTLFEVPTVSYLQRLKQNAEDHGVEMVLIMVDDEGETCTPSSKERAQTVINHQKWIDIAHYLGCHSIRTNCRGPENAPKEEALKWAADTYNLMLEYAMQAKIGIVIENHGGLSNDADWMIKLFKEVDNYYFGSYPDWRGGPGKTDFDNVDYLRKMLPYASGQSYRNQVSEELTAQMIQISKDAGYRGWYGIESSGREAIREGKKVLSKYLGI